MTDYTQYLLKGVLMNNGQCIRQKLNKIAQRDPSCKDHDYKTKNVKMRFSIRMTLLTVSAVLCW